MGEAWELTKEEYDTISDEFDKLSKDEQQKYIDEENKTVGIHSRDLVDRNKFVRMLRVESDAFESGLMDGTVKLSFSKE